jgi:hypothetical protein
LLSDGANTYRCDYAQRLANVNGGSYTWDGNGNPSLRSGQALLSNGVNTYTYDHANRLTAVGGPQTAFNFGYK